MTTYEIGYKVADGVWSVNTVIAHTFNKELARLAAEDYAREKAAWYHTFEWYRKEAELTDDEIESRRRRGMPIVNLLVWVEKKEIC